MAGESERWSLQIDRLEVEGLRKIRSARMNPASGANWIVGPNGSGKTSLLEALYLLSRGKSFRGIKHGPLFGAGLERIGVHAQVSSEGRVREIGFQRDRATSTWVENGVQRTGQRELSVRLHVRLIGENSQRLLEGDPELRRLFLDWNLFHVEPAYGELLSRFRRVRAQRNAWLRAGGRGRPVWDPPYTELATEVTARRRRFVELLSAEFADVTARLGVLEPLQIELARGWGGADEGLIELLAAQRDTDIRLGFTHLGPGRADLRVVTGSPVKGLRSRGELKVLVCALQLAAQRLWARAGLACVWLVDDLAAELDPDTLGRVWQGLRDTNLQIFATTLTDPVVSGQVFHVEQGRITAANLQPTLHRSGYNR